MAMARSLAELRSAAACWPCCTYSSLSRVDWPAAVFILSEANRPSAASARHRRAKPDPMRALRDHFFMWHDSLSIGVSWLRACVGTQGVARAICAGTMDANRRSPVSLEPRNLPDVSVQTLQGC